MFLLYLLYFQANNLSKIIETSTGVGVSPNDPGQNSTTIITSEGDIYGATNIGKGNRDPVIYRGKGSDSNELRTAQANSKWLNGIILNIYTHILLSCMYGK